MGTSAMGPALHGLLLEAEFHLISYASRLCATRSLWIDGTELPPTPPLTASISTDVCIVGAGIAGLTTAYLLSREGVTLHPPQRTVTLLAAYRLRLRYPRKRPRQRFSRNQACNSSAKANTGALAPLPIRCTGRPRLRSQRCAVRTPRSNSEAIFFQPCSARPAC
jgi:hypothetical protein